MRTISSLKGVWGAWRPCTEDVGLCGFILRVQSSNRTLLLMVLAPQRLFVFEVLKCLLNAPEMVKSLVLVVEAHKLDGGVFAIHTLPINEVQAQSLMWKPRTPQEQRKASENGSEASC